MPSDGQTTPAVHNYGPVARVLTFHKSTTAFTWGATNYEPSRMRRLLRFLVGEGYSLVPLEEAATAPRENTIAVTFDDGYRHLRNVLPPLMQEFAFQPTVFVPTACIGCDNDWDYSHVLSSCPHLDIENIAALVREGVEFGSHGHRHCNLTGFGRDELLSELRLSRRRLIELTGQPITSISYPFGRHNTMVSFAAEEAGYEHGFSMAFPNSGQPNLARGRLAIYGFDTPLSVLIKLRPGTAGYRVEKWKAALTNRLAGGSILLERWRGRGQ